MVSILIAKDAKGNTRSVQNISKKEKWRCVECDEILVPRMGDVKVWHWAHKSNSNCSGGESEWHKTAKKIVCENIKTLKFQKIWRQKILCTCSPAENFINGRTITYEDSIVKEYTLLEAKEEQWLPSLHMRPDISLYEEGKLVGVIEICHTNAKKDSEIESFKKMFDGFFFEWNAEKIIRQLETSHDFLKFGQTFKTCEFCEKDRDKKRQKSKEEHEKKEEDGLLDVQKKQEECRLKEELRRRMIYQWEDARWVSHNGFYAQSSEWLLEISQKSALKNMKKEEAFWTMAKKASEATKQAEPLKQLPIKRKHASTDFEEACIKFAKAGW